MTRDRVLRPIPAAWTLLLTAVLLGLAGCATPPPPLVDTEPGEYRLDAGDTIQVEVYGQKDLSGRFTLDTGGRVSLLRAGVIDLRRRTFREAEQLIAAGLRAELREPEVAVNIAEYRPVFMTGEVRRPGRFPYEQGMTVLKALALAGGYTPRGSRGRITLVREDLPRVRVGEDTRLRPGDAIDVGQSLF